MIILQLSFASIEFPTNKNNNTKIYFCLNQTNIIYIFKDDLRGEVMVAPAKKLEDLIHLAELCVDLLQQNEEHYAEVGVQHRLS